MLRSDFLAAQVGIVGSNALVAATGHSLLVTNEGNGDLCANLPEVLIVCTSVDRILPRTSDALAMLRLLVRSTTGQPISSYTSFYGGPRRDTDPDGPRVVRIQQRPSSTNRSPGIRFSDVGGIVQPWYPSGRLTS